MIDRLVSRLIGRIEELESIVNQLDRRANNLIREGKVAEVDYEKGTVKVETNGVLSKPLPWVQRAGDILEWDPPAVGERVMMISPTGEPGNGIVLPGGFSEKFPKNHTEGAVKRVTIGNSEIDQSDAGFLLTVGGAALNLTEDGLSLTVGGTTYTFTEGGFVQNGGQQTHDGKNVGSTHGHITAPPGPVGPPV